MIMEIHIKLIWAYIIPNSKDNSWDRNIPLEENEGNSRYPIKSGFQNTENEWGIIYSHGAGTFLLDRPTLFQRYF